MKGVIYRVPIKHASIEQHPHVVVIVAGKQCFVVPGYTPGKPKVTEAINALIAIGTPPEKVYVKLNNATHVKPLSSFTWHECIWLTSQAYWASKDDFELVAPDGIMDAAGMEALARGMLALAEEKDELFSPRELELLRRWLPPEP